MAAEWDASSPGPADIAGRTFPLSRRGYEPADVDRFLGEVAERVAGMEEELRWRRPRMEMLERQSSMAREAAYTRHLADVLRGADEAAEAIRAEAEAEAAAMVEEARRQAAALITAGRARADRERQAPRPDPATPAAIWSERPDGVQSRPVGAARGSNARAVNVWGGGDEAGSGDDELEVLAHLDRRVLELLEDGPDAPPAG